MKWVGQIYHQTDKFWNGFNDVRIRPSIFVYLTDVCLWMRLLFLRLLFFYTMALSEESCMVGGFTQMSIQERARVIYCMAVVLIHIPTYRFIFCNIDARSSLDISVA